MASNEFQILDEFFHFSSYRAENLHGNPQAQINSLEGVWMTVGEGLTFMPARKSWIAVHVAYKALRKENNDNRRIIRSLQNQPKPCIHCRRRLQPLVRLILRQD